MEERAFTQTRAFAQTRYFYKNSLFIRLVIFTLLSIVLLSFNHLRPAFIFEMRRYLNDGLVYMLKTIGQPLSSIEKKVIGVRSFIDSFQKIQELEAQVKELELWQNQARQLYHENKKLQESLRYIKRDLPVLATARAFFSFDGRYLQSMTLDVGEIDGIQLNQPVVAYGRLIGRIVEVSPYSSRVLLITDVHSRIPIETEWSQLRGILTGTNSKRLVFLHEREKKDLQEGELVFTTGEGGIFPAGFIVGKLGVTSKEEIFVDPGIEWRKIDVVQVLRLPHENGSDLSSMSGGKDEN